MQYFDTRLNRTLMENRLEEAKASAKRTRVRVAIPRALKERVGAWLITQGKKLADSTPKMA